MENTQGTKPQELIYGLEDRPPLRATLFAALQHLLAVFVAIITPPLIIAGALKLDLDTTGFLVSMSLFVSGVATFIQCRKLGPLGCGLLCVQGTSFSFIGPIIIAGLGGGLPAVFGATIAGSIVEMLISRVLKYTRRIITPLVSGIVVTLIGLSLIKVVITACGGGEAAKAAGTFGSFENVGLAALVLVFIIFFNRSSNPYLRMSSIVIGLIIGYVVAYFMIGKFNYATPGRLGNYSDGSGEEEINSSNRQGGENTQAERIIALLGGRENITLVDACMTRLRVTVKDADKVQDADAWKKEGAL